MGSNTLYYGDNLDILRRYLADETVDLIYLDPPFKSEQTYNVLFAEQDGSRAAAQIKAFEDTWRWDQAAAQAYQEVVEMGGQVAQTMQAFRLMLGNSDMLAYLAMMAPRLVELHRVLKSTGSLYLHCDPTASHYLKVLMDATFGPRNFRNEITWKRTSAHSDPRRWGRIRDEILFYTKTNEYTWNVLYQSYDEAYVKDKYRYEDKRGQYRLDNLTGAGITKEGDSSKPWKGFNPSEIGRHWAIPRNIVEMLIDPEQAAQMNTQQKLDLLDQHDYIYWTPKGRSGGPGFPQLKRYLGSGVPIQDVLIDIPPINSQAAERLGYPTQKPEALLERIIQASSNEGDIVLDPFCGCGTVIATAQKLHRRWIGIDITHLAITLIKHRLQDTFDTQVSYTVLGEPVSLPDAEALATQDRYQFQWWALGLVGARPVEQKKGSDQGIDGRLYFHDEGAASGKTKQIILSVKSGHVSVRDVRDLRGVIDREQAQIGVLMTLQNPTQPMRTEAASAGFYASGWGGKTYPRLQILTITDLLAGKTIAYPPSLQVNRTYKKAPTAPGKPGATVLLPLHTETA